MSRGPFVYRSPLHTIVARAAEHEVTLKFERGDSASYIVTATRLYSNQSRRLIAKTETKVLHAELQEDVLAADIAGVIAKVCERAIGEVRGK